MYMKIIRAALVAYASKVVGRLHASNNKNEISAIAHELVLILRLLDYIDNGVSL